MQRDAIEIDGSFGEGGGQILRSSLSLSMITGTPFRINNIRSGRQKPGLMRQHLTSVKAAAEICDAKETGAEIGSRELFFAPGKVKGGDYHFAIGTAGSTSLVAQTVIPALMFADAPSKVVLEGGTHNMQSPPFDFLKFSLFPLLEKMGARIESELHDYGFYPVGGGKVEFGITPVEKLQPLHLLERGGEKSMLAEALFASLSVKIAKRELKMIARELGWTEDRLKIREVKNSASPGNIVFLKLEHDNVTEIIAGFGVRGVKAENVAKRACGKARKYLGSRAAVSEHLADQLLLPMALAGEGEFTTIKPSSHVLTNIEVIKKFIPCSITTQERDENLWTIKIGGMQ